MGIIENGEWNEEWKGTGPTVEIGERTRDRTEIGTGDHHLHIGNITQALHKLLVLAINETPLLAIFRIVLRIIRLFLIQKMQGATFSPYPSFSLELKVGVYALL